MAKKIEVFASEALPGELEDFPDIKRGWGTTKESTGGIPPMKWFNAIQKRTDEAINAISDTSVGGYTFKNGATLESENDFIYDDVTKSWYFWIGESGKVIPPDSNASEVIESDGGIWSDTNPDGLWVDVGDASLRGDLINGDGSLIGLEHGNLNAAIYYVTPEMFAELDTPETYNTNALKAAISHKRPCYLSAKEYITLEPLVFKSHKVIQGAGHELCRIVKKGPKTSGLPDHVIGASKKKIKLDVDAVMIAYSEPNYWYAERTELNGFSLYLEKLEGEIEGSKPKRYVLYAPLIAQSSYTNMQCEGHNAVGVYCIDYWMVNWNRVHSKCDSPWLLGDTSTDWTANGTSNTFISCWATSTKGDNYSWKIENMQYSTMISCGNDGVGIDGKPALGVYHFTRSDVTMINCGAEIIHAESFMKAYINSRISFVGGNFADIFNKYLPKNIAWNNTNALFQAFNNSRISMTSGVYVKALYDFGGAHGDNVQSLAHVDDRSFFIWEGFNTVTPTIKRIRPESGGKRTAFGVTFAGNSHVRVITESVEYVGTDNPEANTGTEVASELKDAIRTYKSIYTERDIESFPQEVTSTINLNTLRTRGNVSLHCELEDLNTEENGFPVNSGKYFIKQTSTGGNGTNSRVLQEATRIFGDHQFETWVRTADKGTWFSAWVKK